MITPQKRGKLKKITLSAYFSNHMKFHANFYNLGFFFIKVKICVHHFSRFKIHVHLANLAHQYAYYQMNF